MSTHKLCALCATLLSMFLLFGTGSAFAQKTAHPLLPSVNLGLSVPKVGVELSIVAPPAAQPVLPVLPSLSVPTVAVRVAPPIVPVAVSATVPPVGNLTPPLGVNVNVNTAALGTTLEAGVGIARSVQDTLPMPDSAPSDPAKENQREEQRRALLPTCR